MHDNEIVAPAEHAKLLACLEIGKALTATFDLDEVLRLIMRTGSEIIPAENWSLLLRDPQTGELTFEVVVGLDPALIKGFKMPRGAGIVGHVAETGQMLLIPDVQSDGRFDPNVDRRTGFATRSLVCVPMTIRGRVLGVIEVVNAADVHCFQEQDAPFLRVLADYAAIAIENSRYVARIEELSVTDEYTGLRNARYLHGILDDLIAHACVAGAPLSVAFADLDNFKRIVDSHGHLMGSQVLREVGVVMNMALSPSDTLVKYGGDEFVVLMPGSGPAQARDTLERIRRCVADAWFLREDPSPVRVTASFGVATYPKDAAGKKDLLLRADNAMYEAKRLKNAVIAA